MYYVYYYMQKCYTYLRLPTLKGFPNLPNSLMQGRLVGCLNFIRIIAMYGVQSVAEAVPDEVDVSSESSST